MELFSALGEGKTQEIKNVLLSEPNRVFDKNENGLSFLMLACYHRNQAIIDLIKELPIELNDPFEMCALGETEELMKFLKTQPDYLNKTSTDGFQLLGYASFFGHEEMVDQLLSLGASINIPSDNYMKVCPLHSAVSNQNEKIVETLLKQGANPNIPQQKGILPIHQAAHVGNEKIFNLLVQYGADITLKSEDGKGIEDYRISS